MQISTIRRTVAACFSLALLLGAFSARAQVGPSAFARGMSVAAGGEFSGFQPDYAGNGIPQAAPLSGYMAGIGTYVDVRFTPWVQVEAEGRWMRFNQPDKGIYEDNYLVGPRLPIYKLHFWHATPYAKALIGFGKLNFEDGNGWGRYTAIAYGGGLDVKLSRRLTARLPDFEYQQWLNWSEGTGKATNLFPYGLSVGVSYRIFGLR